MATVICSNCGAEVILPEKSEYGFGISISKESKGNFVLPMKEKENEVMTKAEMRMEVLRKSGADMSKYFKIDLPTGGDMLMEMINGVPTPVNIDDDPIVEQIFANGYVRNTQLHRRFVLAQMYSMMNYNNPYNHTSGFDAALKAKGYKYQWDMMLEEIRVLSKIEVSDKDTFEQRNKFFTKEVVVDVCEDYLTKLKMKVHKMPEKHCKGVPYKRLKGIDIFVEDLNKKLYSPIARAILKIGSSNNYLELYRNLKSFINTYVKVYKLDYKTLMAPAFKDAYKGAGAYYSLRNLIQFHNCDVVNYETGEVLSGTEAIAYIDSKLNEFKGSGYKYFAMLRSVIKLNNWTPTW